MRTYKLIGAAWLVLGLAGCGNSPEDRAVHFMQSLSTGDIDGIMDVLHPSIPLPMRRMAAEAAAQNPMFKLMRDTCGQVKDLEFVDVKKTDTQWSAKAYLIFQDKKCTEQFRKTSSPMPIALVKIDGQWYGKE